MLCASLTHSISPSLPHHPSLAVLLTKGEMQRLVEAAVDAVAVVVAAVGANAVAAVTILAVEMLVAVAEQLRLRFPQHCT